MDVPDVSHFSNMSLEIQSRTCGCHEATLEM
jgi:hypothetical protein